MLILPVPDSVRNNSAMVCHDSVDNVTCSNSADVSVRPSVISSSSRAAASSEYQVVRTHRRKESKSAPQNCNAGNDTAAGVQDNVDDFVHMNSIAVYSTFRSVPISSVLTYPE